MRAHYLRILLVSQEQKVPGCDATHGLCIAHPFSSHASSVCDQESFSSLVLCMEESGGLNRLSGQVSWCLLISKIARSPALQMVEKECEREKVKPYIYARAPSEI